MSYFKKGEWIYDNFEALAVYGYIDEDATATTKMVALYLDWSMGTTRRLLDQMAAKGYLYKRQVTFWNGMHYAKRNLYSRKAK